MASDTVGMLARSRWPTLADAGARACGSRTGRGEALCQPGRALDPGAVTTRVIANLAIVRDHHDRPGPGRPERAERFGDAIADHHVGGGMAREGDREPRREPPARATAGMAVEDQLDLDRWLERGAQAGDEGGCRERRAADVAGQRVLHVAAVDEDPA